MGRNIRIQRQSIKGFSLYKGGSDVYTRDLRILLKDSKLIMQLQSKNYSFFDIRVHKLRVPTLEILQGFYDFLQELECRNELYTPGNAFPYEISFYPPKSDKHRVGLLIKSDIELSITIEGCSIKYETSLAYWNVVYCNFDCMEKFERSFLLKKYGEPSHIPETKNDIHGPTGNYIIIPIDDVDKLIAIERFRKLDDTDQEPIYTGEERIYELDLRAPEESVYKYFLGRRIIVEYDPENFAPEYLYPPLEEEDTEKQRSKGRYLPSWFRSLCRKISTLFRGRRLSKTL